MQYLLLLTYRPEDNTPEGPELDAEMKRWGELNAEMREAGATRHTSPELARCRSL